jgi:hypothetical protein
MELPWGRFETLLAAKIIQADPREAEDQAKIWEAERFVRAGRSGQSGLKLLIAKANAGDVIWFPAGALGGVGPGGGVGAGPTSLAAAAYGHRLRTAG